MPAVTNVTTLPDHMLWEILARSHDDDLFAALFTCKAFMRVLGEGTSPREVRRPSDAHIVRSEAFVVWAIALGGWTWPTKDK